MDTRKVDEIAAGLDDLSLDVEQLHENAGGIEADKLERLKTALEHARDAMDEIAEGHEGTLG